MKKGSFQVNKKGTVTSPRGFKASGMYCGIKRSRKKYDASLIYSELPCAAGAAFTINEAKAWPVLDAMKAIKSRTHHAILASSGNANCMNGPQGKEALETCVAETAKQLKIKPAQILAAQTGVIGVRFPTDTFKAAIPALVKKLSADRKGGMAAAKGILTTDLTMKNVSVTVRIKGRKVTVGGIAKGSGMIHPNMATMLNFVTTDCAISKTMLQKAVKLAVHDTFNKIAVDNDMSTNDVVFVLANGAAGNAALTADDKDFQRFCGALHEVCRYLAYEIVKDGEGVTHICTLNVNGARSNAEAEKAARQIGTSMLFKTMLVGADPNWGRIAAAVGASGIKFAHQNLSISFGPVFIIKKGRVLEQNRKAARRVLEKKEYQINVTIGKGTGQTTFVTTDLTHRYVDINAAYS